MSRLPRPKFVRPIVGQRLGRRDGLTTARSRSPTMGDGVSMDVVARTITTPTDRRSIKEDSTGIGRGYDRNSLYPCHSACRAAAHSGLALPRGLAWC